MNIRIEIKDDTGKTHYVNDCKSIESLEMAIGQFERHFLKGVEMADLKASAEIEVLEEGYWEEGDDQGGGFVSNSNIPAEYQDDYINDRL